MRKRWTIGVLVIGIVIVSAIIWGVTHDSDPVYEGRHLSEWLKAYRLPRDWQSQEEAKQALRALGPTALRRMVKWIAYEPSMWGSKMRECAKRWPRLPMPQNVRNYMGTDIRKGRAYDALLGFEAFGPVKTNFGPALVRIANDAGRKQASYRAMAVLVKNREFLSPEDFTSQVTNENARQQMEWIFPGLR